MTEFNYSSYGVTQTIQQTQEDAAANGGGGDFKVMEPHTNQLVLDDMEIKTNPLTGTVNLSVTTVIVGEKYQGRKMWNTFNLVKKNGEVNQITQYQLGDLAAAVGFPLDKVLNDPTELMNYTNPFSASIKVDKGSAKGDGTFYDDKNVFANPKPIGVAQTVPKPTPQPAQQGFATPNPQQGFNQPQTGFNQPAFTK